MKFGDTQKKGSHAPVNPFTGMPNDPSNQQAACGAPTTPQGVNGAASASSQQQASAPHAASASGAPSNFSYRGGQAEPWGQEPPAPDPMFTSSNPSTGELLDTFRRVLDSRLLSVVVLSLLSFTVVARENVIAFFIVLGVGYILIDRFLSVRRAVTLGGSAWFLLMFVGNLLVSRAGPIFVHIDYLFMFCGFLLALAVCGVFFAGRAFYYMGFDRGQAEADTAIAEHMIDRLIDNPENVDNLDGTYLEVEGAISRVRDRERQVQDALRDEARRKDDLVTYLAHDLKTPLASVVGYLSLLEEAPDLPLEQRARFTGIALDKAHRLDALIEEFFDITRFDFHDIVLTRGYVDLSLLLAQVADEFYPILTDQGKQVEVDAPASLTVLIDGDKMARVFNNVMKNAIAYSYEGSTIRVAAIQGEHGVTVRFENQGDPIPAPKLGMIFEKFYRLDAARATNRGGAGLGLAIAKEIVAAHGGSIACTSDPEHTVFTIELPEK